MRKKIGLTLALLLSACLLLPACGELPPPKETSLTVEETELKLNVGDTYRLTVSTDAEGGARFESDNQSVAAVSGEGVISALKTGAATVTVRAGDKSESVEVTVKEKVLSGETVGSDTVYSFSAVQDGLYELSVCFAAGGGFDPSTVSADVVYFLDDSYTTRLKSKKMEEDVLYLGTKYLQKGEHILTVKNSAELCADTFLTVKSTLVYGEKRLELSTKWMDELYMETGFNTELPNYLGYVETQGWDDIWTHCQYLPCTMYFASEYKNAEYDRRIRRIADDLLMDKMLLPSGAAYTVYRADDDVFQVSIEPDMPTNKYELWRGNAALAEEMMNCYLYFGEDKYLAAAQKAMDFIIKSWSKTQVNGIFGNFYTRYTDSAGGAIETMSTGRAVMNFARLYELTKDSKYLSAAEAQAKILLKAQETKYPEVEGLFASSVDKSGNLNEFRHGNAYANAMMGLAWCYRVTGKDVYLDAIDKGVAVLDKVYDDERGMIVVMDGRLLPENPGSGPAYMAGRIGQAVMTCAAVTGKIEHYRQGERVLEYAFGRNYGDRDLQNPENGWFYYLVDYHGMSNVETSFEIYLAQMQYYYMNTLCKID